MDVREAVISRRSVRGFLPKAVDAAIVRDVVETAARAASGGICSPGMWMWWGVSGWTR